MTTLIAHLTEASIAHAEDEGLETGMGDMELYMGVMWDMLTPEQKKAFATNTEVLDTLEVANPAGKVSLLTLLD